MLKMLAPESRQILNWEIEKKIPRDLEKYWFLNGSKYFSKTVIFFSSDEKRDKIHVPQIRHLHIKSGCIY